MAKIAVLPGFQPGYHVTTITLQLHRYSQLPTLLPSKRL